MDVIIVLAHGCSVERMRSGWTLYGLPMDAREQAGNYQVFYAPLSSYKGSITGSFKGSFMGSFRSPFKGLVFL